MTKLPAATPETSLVKRLYSMRGKIVDGMATDNDLLDVLADAAMALEHHAAVSESAKQGWQPISTAPKDRDILLTDGKEVSQGGWISDADMGADYEGQFGSAAWWSVNIHDNAPTHWMPLPEAPK